jgi:hypothetical protein
MLELAEGTLPLSSPDVGEVVQGHRIYGHDKSSGKAVTLLDGWEVGSSQNFPSFRKTQTIGGSCSSLEIFTARQISSTDAPSR